MACFRGMRAQLELMKNAILFNYYQLYVVVLDWGNNENQVYCLVEGCKKFLVYFFALLTASYCNGPSQLVQFDRLKSHF